MSERCAAAFLIVRMSGVPIAAGFFEWRLRTLSLEAQLPFYNFGVVQMARVVFHKVVSFLLYAVGRLAFHAKGDTVAHTRCLPHKCEHDCVCVYTLLEVLALDLY